jgi:ubiquinone/menaquinone biosynthesis C-methylase UbiE
VANARLTAFMADHYSSGWWMDSSTTLEEAVRVLKKPSGKLLVFDVLPDGMPVDAWCQSLKGWLAQARVSVQSEQKLALPGGCAVLYLGSPES